MNVSVKKRFSLAIIHLPRFIPQPRHIYRTVMLGATQTTRGASKLAQFAKTMLAEVASTSKTQTRSVGNLPVKSNKYIEDFGARRETIEKEFRWDGPTSRRLLVWGLLVPIGIYKMTCYEFDQTDEFGGKPKRDLWGSPK